jgi:type VI secretion system secreted protein VgrG
MKHPLTLTTPLPAGQLRLSALSARHGVGVLDEVELDLLSETSDIAAKDLLGKPIEVTCALRASDEGIGGSGKRFFGGLCTRFGIGRPVAGGSAASRLFAYQATVRPWLWFLTRTSDCKVFQDKKVPEIVELVLRDFVGADFKFKLTRDYRKRVYCVQYRESDFNFICRLLEDEGIWWYFEHTAGRQCMVITDDMGLADQVPGADTLPFFGQAGSGGMAPDVSYIDSWSHSAEVQTGTAVLQSYDFERPSSSLLVQLSVQREHEKADLEQFDYEGESYLKADAQQRVDNRMDEQAARYERFAGTTNAQALAPGHLFQMARHPRADQNAEFLCMDVRINARAGTLEAGGSGSDWQCSFSAIPITQIFRPPRRTPKPFVQGPQTAVVTGPGGDEIFTDKYGRVKLQFHWDRYGEKDEKSSCWVRVSSPWAGKNFGVIHIPRIGQEVVVSFLEGDPDQPLITGRVYNAEQMPPWELPANMTQSGILTRSTKGGAYGNANAIRFEDKKGSEQLWIHAEKNQDIEVENDETHWVGHDRTKTIDHDETVHVKHDRTETVDNNETITIGVDRTESVGSNETISIGANRSITVGASETATVALQRTHAVGVNETITIGGAQEIAVGAAQTISIGAVQSTSVGGEQTITVGANQTTSVGGDRSDEVGGEESVQIGASRSTSIGKDDALTVAKELVIDAGDSVTIKSGEASITLNKDGTIQIKGKDITVVGSGKIGVKASGDVVVKGSKIAQN